MRYIVSRDADLKSASYLTVNLKRSPHQYILVELRLRVGSTGEQGLIAIYTIAILTLF
jgi:hypothetical protein